MSSAPYCKSGSRRCPVSKKCVKKNKTMKKAPCKKGTRKCADGSCYKKKKSVKSRTRFNRIYGK